MKTLPVALISALALLLAHVAPLSAREKLPIGMAASGAPIDAIVLDTETQPSRTVLVIGGLQGKMDGSSERVLDIGRRYDNDEAAQRAYRLILIPLANPDATALKFPPSGVAYRENPEANFLWRWLGLHAPDKVILIGDDDLGLAEALSKNVVAEVGRIPAARQRVRGAVKLSTQRPAASEAHVEMDRRRARSPRQLADELARTYGHDFDQPLYIQSLALIAQIRLGHLDEVKQLVEPYVDGTKDSLARPNSLVLAGHLVFTELARRTGDERYAQLVKRVADLGFEADGTPKESMPYHDQFSDSLFMGTVIAAQAGALSGERKYFDLAARHVAFMQKLVLRPDGLYRHSPETVAAWGRGNGFPAIGLALALPEFPQDHPEFPTLLHAFQKHMATLAKYQDGDGLWRNVIDIENAYAEVTATAMIGFSMLQGVKHGWLPAAEYQPRIDRAWRAVVERVGAEGHMVDACESTMKLRSVDDYLRRASILGPDPRAGAMTLMFATAMAGLD